jgi:putative glutamine amidotransferase
MPRIAVTQCRRLDDYTHALVHANCEVRTVSHQMSVADALEGIDGLLLTGGDDVAPGRYGEERHATVVNMTPERDDFEIALVHEARRRRLPILAICRGLQVLNVACGGSLVQDIPSQIAGALEHKTSVPPHQSFDVAHEIWLEKGSLLAELMRERLGEADSCEVNSRHHQAVNTLAPGFRVVATSPDGVIEAIEEPGARFCLGVQWHPENFWRTGEFRGLFEGFVQAAATTTGR